MNAYTKVSDPWFAHKVTLGQAYRIMERFLSDYLQRGDTPVVDFLVHFGLQPDGESSDPAALDDFLAAAEAILDQDGSDWRGDRM